MPDKVIIIEDKPEEKPVEAIEKIAEEIEETPVVSSTVVSSTEAVELALRQQEDRVEAEAVQENIKQEISWTGDRIGWLESSIMDTNIKLDTLINLLTPKEDEIMPEEEEEKPIVIEEEKKPEEKPEEKKSEETPVESSEKKKRRYWI